MAAELAEAREPSRNDLRPQRREHLGSMALSVEQRLCLAIAGVLALIIVAILAAILWICDGHLIYSLDDPFISLSLGWHIGHGQYGVNAGEAASPSSSILYPLILAGFAWASWQQWVPLVVNAAAAVGTGVVFGAAVCRYGLVTREDQIARGTALVVTLCVAVNTIGLVFVGLEHSLHALASVVIVFGLARALEEGRISAWLLVAIVLAPLWRFEGIALALLAIGGLAATGHLRAAVVALCGVLVTLGADMAAMHALGLPLLPSSVLTKSEVAKEFVGGALGPIGMASLVVRDAFARLNGEAWPVFLLTVLVIAHPVWRAVRPAPSEDRCWSLWREAVFAGVVAGALIAHILFGAWGWFARYEAYAVAFGAAAILVLWRREIAHFVARQRPIVAGYAMVALVYFGFFYVVATVRTPLAAREIYEQQYQMHRFAVDFYRRPVGVNDLGWVSYRNPNYVLDLWGLGSEPARQARARGEVGWAWTDRLVKAKQVGLVMIYDRWFAGQIPPDWRRLAVLRTTHRVVTASDSVVFYATSPGAVADGLAALQAFDRQLVPGASLTIFEQSPAKGATAWP